MSRGKRTTLAQRVSAELVAGIDCGGEDGPLSKLDEKLAINRELVHLRTKLEIRTLFLRVSLSLNTALVGGIVVKLLIA